MRGFGRSSSYMYELDGFVVLLKKLPLLGALVDTAFKGMNSWEASELVAPLNLHKGSIYMPIAAVLVPKGDVKRSDITRTQIDSEVNDTNATASWDQMFMSNTRNLVRTPSRMIRGETLEPTITSVVLSRVYSRENLRQILRMSAGGDGSEKSGVIDLLGLTKEYSTIWQKLAVSKHFNKGLNSLATHLNMTSVKVDSAQSLGLLIGRINDLIIAWISGLVNDEFPTGCSMMAKTVKEMFEAIETDLLSDAGISLATTRSILTEEFAQKLELFISQSQANMVKELGYPTLNHFPRLRVLFRHVDVGLDRSLRNVVQLKEEHLNSSNIPETIPIGVEKTICHRIKRVFKGSKGVNLTEKAKDTIIKKLEELEEYCAVQSVLVPVVKYLEKIKSLNASAQPSSRTMELVNWLLNFILLGGCSSISNDDVVAQVTASLGKIIDIDLVIGDIKTTNSKDFKLKMYSMPNHKNEKQCIGIFSDDSGNFGARFDCSAASLSSSVKSAYENRQGLDRPQVFF